MFIIFIFDYNCMFGEIDDVIERYIHVLCQIIIVRFLFMNIRSDMLSVIIIFHQQQ